MEASLLFTNTLVVDGTASVPYLGMVAITGKDILYAGPPREDIGTKSIIDLQGKYLVPGFIDMHGHSDLQVLRNPAMKEKIAQGITTEVIGNCGMGVYPLAEDSVKRGILAQMATDILGVYGQPWSWTDVETYIQLAGEYGCSTRLVAFQAHAPLRIAALDGNPNRPASAKEIEKMVALLHRSYDQGAVGFSSGLYYAPCLFASREELLALLRVTAERDCLFSVHHRCEGDGVVNSLEEVLGLALETRVRIEISHLKAIGKRNQEQVPAMLALLESYEERGLQVGFDQYPYTFGSTSLYSLLPPKYLSFSREELIRALRSSSEREKIRHEILQADGWDSIVSLCGWDAISVVYIDGMEELKDNTLAELAVARGLNPFDLLFDLLAKGPETAVMADVTQSEQSLQTILRHRLGCFGTDALYSGYVRHPRSYRATRHLFTRYGKELQTLPIESLIARMTGEPARRLRLEDRGVIKQGFLADLVVLDMDAMDDTESPGQGIPMVMMGGEMVLNEL